MHEEQEKVMAKLSQQLARGDEWWLSVAEVLFNAHYPDVGTEGNRAVFSAQPERVRLHWVGVARAVVGFVGNETAGAAEKRIGELEAELAALRAVPPGVPSVEDLARVGREGQRRADPGWVEYDKCCKPIQVGLESFAAAVRDAVLASLPVLTWEEVDNQHREHKGFSLSDAAPDTFTGWLASRLPARLEPVLTREEVEAIHNKYRVRAGFSRDWETAFDKLSEEVLSRLPARLEPMAVTEEEIMDCLDAAGELFECPLSEDQCKALAQAIWAMLHEKQLVKPPVVPEGVPSAEDIASELDRDDECRNAPSGRTEDVQYTYDRLAPFLQPAAAVGIPDAEHSAPACGCWRYDLENAPRGRVLVANEVNTVYVADNIGICFSSSPGQWPISNVVAWAEIHPPARPEERLTDIPKLIPAIKAMHAMQKADGVEPTPIRYLRQWYQMLVPSYKAQPGFEYRLKAFLNEPDEKPDPIATAETLEQLAEIAWNAIPRPLFFSELTEKCKQHWRNVATAILRAARPELNICSASTWRSGESVLHAADLPSLNPYIRYRVELPTDAWKSAVDDALVCCDMTADSFESPREAVQALLKYHKDVDGFFARDEMRERQIACYEHIYTHLTQYAYNPDARHKCALESATSLPVRLAELNEALDAKGGE